MHVHIDRVFTTVARNLGLKDFSRYTNDWIEWSYEAEKLIGSRDTFVEKESTYTSTGSKATGTIKFTSNPASGDSITLNGVRLYFKKGSIASITNSTADLGRALSPNEITIGSNLKETIDNITQPYGLIQSLTGLQYITAQQGTYVNSAVFNYPEALNVADYTITQTTAGDDLVADGDFSDATNPSPSWYGTNFSYNPGGFGLVSVPSVESDGVPSLIRKDIATYVDGTSYLLTFRAKGSATNEIIVLDHPSAVGGLQDQQGSITLTTDYVDYSFRFTANENSSTVYFKQANLSDVNWTFQIDDVSVKAIDTITLNVTSKEIGPEGNDYTLDSDTSTAQISGLSLAGGKGIYRNQQIVLPEDNINVLGVRVGTDDSDHEHAELRKTSAIHKGRVGKTTDDSQQRSFRYYIEGNRLNIQHDNLDEITVVYLKYPTDIRGWPMIKEGHETAVSQYIMWQMKLIEFYNGKLPQYITKELEKRWYFLCGKTRGDDSMPTSEELKQIGNMWNTLVPLTNDGGSGLINF